MLEGYASPLLIKHETPRPGRKIKKRVTRDANIRHFMHELAISGGFFLKEYWNMFSKSDNPDVIRLYWMRELNVI